MTKSCPNTFSDRRSVLNFEWKRRQKKRPLISLNFKIKDIQNQRFMVTVKKPKKKKEAMKTVVLTATAQTAGIGRDRSENRTGDRDGPENRDSYYFPGCRKDTNCHCEMCLASINATLDLQSSLTKLSSNTLNKTFPASPEPNACWTPATPFRSTAKSRHPRNWVGEGKGLESEKGGIKSRFGAVGGGLGRLMLVLSLIFVVSSGFQWLIFEILRPEMSPEIVRRIGEESGYLDNLNERLDFVQTKLGKIAPGKISNCSAFDSVWELNQGGFLLHSRCILYKSPAEEVSIWGWPLQTNGLSVAGFSSRSLTIISGRVIEWQDGRMVFSVKKEINSWIMRKWSACALQLDRNTWLLEYRRSAVLENPKLFSIATELLKFRIYKLFQEFKQGLWLLLPVVPDHYSYHIEGLDHKIPT